MSETLYLASASPRRRALLRRLGVSFRVVASSHRERIVRDLGPSANALRNAAGKALKARVAARSGLVLGADTFIYFRGQVFGKPRDLAQARRWPAAFAGRSHWVYTGVAIRDLASGRLVTGVCRTRVVCRRLSADAIERYLRATRPLDKAGAYAIQDDQGRLIARIRGSRSNVIGLPLALMRQLLRRCRLRGR
jgi:septum formation protein